MKYTNLLLIAVLMLPACNSKSDTCFYFTNSPDVYFKVIKTYDMYDTTLIQGISGRMYYVKNHKMLRAGQMFIPCEVFDKIKEN